MNRLNRYVSIGAVATLAVAALSALPTQSYGSNPGPVFVTNTPLPVSGTVTGSVSIAGLPTVDARQSGGWEVAIAGTPTVEVGSLPAVHLAPGASFNVGNDANSPVPTVNTENPAKTAFQLSLFMGDECATVPDNKRWVIEFASASSVASNPSASVVLGVVTTVGGSVARHTIPLERQTLPGGNGASFAGATAMRAYADAGTDVCADSNGLYGGPFGTTSVALSGYVVDMP